MKLQSLAITSFSKHTTASQTELELACENITGILALIGQENKDDSVDIQYINQLVSNVAKEIEQLKALSSSNSNDCSELQQQGHYLSEVTEKIVNQLAMFKTR